MTPLYTVLFLALTVMTGCGAVCVLLILRQRRIIAEIDRLKNVFQDFLSVQERNLHSLRMEIRTQNNTDYLPRRTVSSSLSSTETGRENNPTTSPPDEAKEYQESVEMIRKKKQVWDLADSGLDVEEISRQSRLPSGQVDVILNMRHLDDDGGRP
jgi:hypothetical protein